MSYFSLLDFYDELFGHLFMCRTILTCFFEVTSQSGEMRLKTLSSSSKLATTVATLLFVGRWFALKQKKIMYFQKQNEPLTKVKGIEGVQIVKNVQNFLKNLDYDDSEYQISNVRNNSPLHRQAHRQTERQIDRQTDSKTEKQTDRQAGR